MFAVREQRTFNYKLLIMKSQDVLILLKKLTFNGKNLSCRGLAESLGMSASSVSDSLKRCQKAQLVDRHKKRVNAMAFQEFLIHGISYVFPAEAGRVGRGVPTYVSASPFLDKIAGNTDCFVWHYVKRSEERRVGKECIAVCRSRWSPYH